MSPAPASVVLRDVSRSFGPRVVLDQISLTISPRSRIGVIAPNGTGKSTLLRLVAGLDRPDSGAITRLPPSATVGYLPQEPDARPGRNAARLPRSAAPGSPRPTHCVRSRHEGVGRRRARRRRRLRRRASTPIWRSAPPTSTPAPSAVVERVGLPAALLDRDDARDVGRAGRPGVARGDPALPLRRVPARRTHERSRLRRSRTLRRVPPRAAGRRRHRVPRPGLPRSHDHVGARTR